MILFLRRLIFEDFWLKLFSLVLSILIWFTVWIAIQKEVSPIAGLTPNNAERVFFNLPVVVMSSAEDVRNLRVNPQEVSVTVQGDRKMLETLHGQDIRVMVDLTHVEASRLRRRIEISTPAGIMHVRVDPQEVEVILPPKS